MTLDGDYLFKVGSGVYTLVVAGSWGTVPALVNVRHKPSGFEDGVAFYTPVSATLTDITANAAVVVRLTEGVVKVTLANAVSDTKLQISLI